MTIDASVSAAIFYAVLGFVVAWATVILIGQFYVMWAERHVSERRVRDLGRMSDDWMPEKPWPVRRKQVS